MAITPSAWAASAGTQIWAKRYDGPASAYDVAGSLAVSRNGSTVFVTGYSKGGSTTGYDYATVAYSASTGAAVWTKRFNGPASLDDYATSLAVSPDSSRVFVTGYSKGGRKTGFDYATVAYSASTGAAVWTKRYNGPASGDDISSSLAVNPNGSAVFVTGHSGGGATGNDYATVAYSASTGTELWAKRYDGPASGDDKGTSLAVSPSGSTVFVTGNSDGGTRTGLDYATVAYSAFTGAALWTSRYDGPAGLDDYATSLGVSPDSARVFVTGYSWGGRTTSDDYATIAYSASTGAERWASRFNGPTSGYDLATSLGVSPDGSRVFVTGYSDGNTNYDYATLAYSASTGAAAWTKRYNGPASSFDLAFSLGVSPDGSMVFVGGYSYGRTYPDYATVAYSTSTGTAAWSSRYNGPSSLGDEAFALGVSPDSSNVFVTGYSDGNTNYDYATVAYAA